MFDRPRFVHQYNTARTRALAGQGSAAASETGITFRDQHGKTAVVLRGMQPDEAPLVTSFDIAYAHVRKGKLPEPHLLAGTIDGLPADTRFRGTGIFAAEPKRRESTVDVNILELTRRAGLMRLAHEIGHITQAEAVTIAVETAIDLSPDPAGQERIDRYAPAVDTLATYARRNPNFAEDYLQTREAWLRNGVTASPYMHQPPNTQIPILARFHEDTYEAVSAIAEASAWIGGLAIVEAGQLHPGQSTAEMHELAHWAVGTYDQQADTPLHGSTLTYALSR